MRRITLLLGLLFMSSTTLFSQNKEESGRVDLKDKINTWAIGGGLSNFIAHGDLRSIGTGNQGNYWNFGWYLNINKMLNPVFGFEAKFNYNKIAGGSQSFSQVYSVLYVNKDIRNDFHFSGRAYGVEASLIFSLSNLYNLRKKRWNLLAYFGAGYHVYNTKLFQRETELIDFGKSPTTDGQAGSYYITSQLGLRYKLTRFMDLELRPGIYFNNEDHLDAAIADKQDWETFFITNLGVVFKLGNNKKKTYAIWATEDDIEKEEPFTIKDGDKDGVIDELDKDPNTPPGVMVYGSGIPIDSDGDKVPDYKDKCRFEIGLINNDGCPFLGDRDKDGIPDRDDACPDEKGLEKYRGCPDSESEKLTELIEVLSYAKNIYFSNDSNEIESAYYYTMLDEVADIMLKNPNVSFSVSGYTDNKGTVDYNIKLSQRRANQARTYLISRGVEPDRVTAKWFGKLNPKFSNATPQGKQLNRRVEIKSVGPYTQKTTILRETVKEKQ